MFPFVPPPPGLFHYGNAICPVLISQRSPQHRGWGPHAPWGGPSLESEGGGAAQGEGVPFFYSCFAGTGLGAAAPTSTWFNDIQLAGPLVADTLHSFPKAS